VIFVVFVGVFVVVILKRYRSVYRIRRIRRDIRLGAQLGFPMSQYPDHIFSFSRRERTVDIGENVQRSDSNGGYDNQNWENDNTATSLQHTGASKTQVVGVGPAPPDNEENLPGPSNYTSDPNGVNRQRWDSLGRRANNVQPIPKVKITHFKPSNPPPLPRTRNQPFAPPNVSDQHPASM
jgi:hypothetical protein